jgi:hypothetical protein
MPWLDPLGVRDHIREFARAHTAVQITDHPIIYVKSPSAPVTTLKASPASLSRDGFEVPSRQVVEMIQ